MVPSARIRRFASVTALLAVLLLAACSSSSDGDSSATLTDTLAGTDPTAAATDAAPSETAAATEAPATAEPEPGPFSPYEDGSNDCKRNADYAESPVCMPLDIESVTISRASLVTIVVAFRAPPTTNHQRLVAHDRLRLRQ